MRREDVVVEIYENSQKKRSRCLHILDQKKRARQKKWDFRYLRIAVCEVATWSKDPVIGVGCVLVRPNNTIASTGYNGFPPGHSDDHKLYLDYEYKTAHIVHAEENALCFAGDVKAFTMYTSLPPCPKCMRRAGEAGISRIVSVPLQAEGRSIEWCEKWRLRFIDSSKIAKEYGIVQEFLSL